jgi:glycosyltransferase involved in cell wall biosynthesis
LATQGLLAIQDAPFAVRAEPTAMAAAIVALWSDPDERDRLGTAARAWVIEHHTWAATAREAIAALERSSATSRCGR